MLSRDDVHDRQSVFEFVVGFLRKQGHQATSDDGLCFYRDPEGRSCAVGCLISDEVYDESLEDHMPDEFPIQAAILQSTALSEISNEDAEFLRDLQLVHDQNRDPDLWEREWENLANIYKLDFPSYLLEGKIAIRMEADIRSGASGGTANRNTYRVSPPIKDYDWDDEETGEYEFVAVSQANALYSGWETFIFPCDENGEITKWGELPGSRRGYVSPDDLLRELGYTIVEALENEG